MILFMLPAFAEVFVGECYESPATLSVPGNGANGVPVDVKPAFLFGSPCPLGPLIFQLATPGGAEPTRDIVVQPDEHTPFEAGMLVEVELGAPLSPSTDYSLQLVNGSQGPQELVFRTAGTSQDPIDGAPGLRVVEALRYRGIDAAFQATFEVEPTGDGSLFVLSVDGAPRAAFRGPGREPFETDARWSKLGDGRRFCASVQERDLAGTWSEPSAEVCDAAPPRGCQHVPVGLLAGLVCVPLVRRRRCAR